MTDKTNNISNNPSEQNKKNKEVKEEKKKSLSKIIIIIFIILVLLGLVGLCVLVYTILKTNKTTSNESYSQNKQCVYNNITYNDGDKFEAIDGCNSCFCSDGQVSCTEMYCIKNGESEEVDEDEGNAEDSRDTTKEVNFSVTHNEVSLDKDVKLNFIAQVPVDSTVDESLNTSTLENILPWVTITGSNYTFEVYWIFDLEVSHYPKITNIYTHAQFGDIYRISEEGSNVFEYTNDITLSGKCDANAGELNAPCGQSFIKLEGNIYFIPKCETSEENVEICDDIIKSVSVTEEIL